jgi:hypothetical protein
MPMSSKVLFAKTDKHPQHVLDLGAPERSRYYHSESV